MSNLSDMSVPGYCTFTSTQIKEAEAMFQRLKKERHAIIFNVTCEYDGKYASIFSLHYLTCRVCYGKK